MKSKPFFVLIALIMLLIISGCAKDVNDAALSLTQNKELDFNSTTITNKSSKILFIIAQNEFQDDELIIPLRVFKHTAYKAYIASINQSFAYGMDGNRVKPDLAAKDVNPLDYEYIVVVGGVGSPSLAEHPDVLNVLRGAKRTAAICLGPMVLAKAGVLDGKRATVSKTIESVKALKDGGAVFVDERLVVDGTTITANAPDVSEEFAEKILNILNGGS